MRKPYCTLLAVACAAGLTFRGDAATPEIPAKILEANHVKELLVGPASPNEHEPWLHGMKTWRAEQRRLLEPVYAELGDPYSLPEFGWTRTNYVQPQMMAHDRYFYDPTAGRYTVDKYLDDLEARYGGIDSVLVWPTYPNIGIDDRNQYDLWRDMPGGLEGVRKMVEDFHRRDVRVFVPIMYWDHGTRDEGTSMPEALARLCKEINADGLNGDTMSGVTRDYYEASVAAGHPLVMEPENGIEDPLGLVWNTMTWGYWWPYQEIPPVNKFRWLERRHMTHVCDRWAHSRNDLLQLAFFNGAGHQSWENVWGIWNGMTPRDGEAVRRMRMIYKAVGDLLSSEDYVPHYPTHQDGVYATFFPGKTESFTTVVNRTTGTVTGKQLTLTAMEGARYFELWTGQELTPEVEGTSVTVSFDMEPRGFAAVLATQEPSTSVTQLVAEMKKRSGVSLGDLSAEWQIMKQKIVPIEKTKRVMADAAPEGMVAIPAGRSVFEVEGVMVEKNEGNDFQYPWEERPELKHRHEMDMAAFYMDKYPVTCGEFQKFLEATDYGPADDHNFLRDWKGRQHPEGWEKKPVTWVGLEDARAYAAWAGKRLPHEWEWQYAAQGTDQRKYPWGNGKNAEAMPKFTEGRVQPVRADVDAHPKGASPFGVMDMVGNVWQWTDEYRDEHTRAAVLRGGSSYRPSGSNWYFPQAHELHTHGKYLLMAPSLDRSASIGFRCVMDVEAGEKEIVANTFSIVAADPETGEVGVAVATKLPAVGMYVPFAAAGVGAVASQAIVNPAYGPECLRLLKEGMAPEDIVSSVTKADAQREDRQLSVITPDGRAAGFTGKDNSEACGHLVGKNCVVAGNLLASSETLTALRDTFEKTEGHLSHRMMMAMAAGEAAGGDKRGKQSAAIIVVKPKAYFNGKVVDLRVDDDADPIRKLTEIHRNYMATFLNLPGYRDMKIGVRGGDVKKLNGWLVAAGHGDRAALVESGDVFTSATASGVEAFLGAEGKVLGPGEAWRLQRLVGR